jgi:3-(3-hydroxy-phenyl)propionate hydroxylase
VGYHFALLCEAGCDAELTQQHRAEMAAVGVAVLHGGEAAGLEAWLSKQGLKAAIVRPDRYILGTARRNEDVLPLLSALTLTTFVSSAA